MTAQGKRYEIRVDGQLPEAWSEWFGRLEVENEPGNGAVLTGLIVDQAALIGLLTRIHSLNLQIASVRRLSPEQEQRDRASKPSKGERL